MRLPIVLLSILPCRQPSALLPVVQCGPTSALQMQLLSRACNLLGRRMWGRWMSEHSLINCQDGGCGEGGKATMERVPNVRPFQTNVPEPLRTWSMTSLSGWWMWGRWKSEDETGAQQEMDELGVGSLETVEMGYGSSKRCRGLGIKYGLRGDKRLQCQDGGCGRGGKAKMERVPNRRWTGSMIGVRWVDVG